MIRIGIAGFGLMGRTHLKAYMTDPRAQVLAISDVDRSRVEATGTEGNIAGQTGAPGTRPIDPRSLRFYESFEAMLADPEIDAVSICSPTPLHVEMAIAAIRAGRHVLIEKPLGLTYDEALRAIEESRRRPATIAMPAMCMRFWPAWSWLRDAIASQRYGPVRAATFTRLGSMPTWASFYGDAAQSGGGILDLHIHDADFVRFCFGDPDAVESHGYSETTRGVDHVVTRYHYADAPALITAEGGWSMKPGFAFTMRYLVNFERATAGFDLRAAPPFRVHTAAGDEAVEIAAGEGYEHEVRHFLDCVERGRQSPIVTMHDGAEAVRLIEAERKSVQRGERVVFRSAESLR